MAEANEWRSQPCIMGIDEAGRGPVLGPMVYAAAYCPAALMESLAMRAFADSKTLTEEKRDALLADIRADPMMGTVVDSLSAAEISAKMLQGEKVGLNTMANEATFRLIDAALTLGVNLTAVQRVLSLGVLQVYVDTVGDADRHRERLSQRFPGVAFTVCPKADAIYPIVSAASIVAKTTRDAQLRGFEPAEAVSVQRDFGSGYPGDAITQAWLLAHKEPVFGFPSLVRFSWQSTARLMDEHCCKVQFACDSEDMPGQQALAFGSAQPRASNGAGRHSYMRARKLQRMQAF